MINKFKRATLLQIIPLLLLLSVVVSVNAISSKCDDGIYSYQLVKVIQVAGRQGVATDGTYYFISCSKALYKYTKDGKLIKENLKPFEPWCPTCNHLGDIDYYDGEIYAGAEKFSEGRGWDMSIAIYDADTLKFKRSIPLDEDSGQVEICGLTVDPIRRIVWTADWCDATYLYQYDLSTGKYIGKLHLHPVPEKTQGIFYHDGYIFLTADDGDAEFWEFDNLYRIDVETATTALVIRERTLYEFTRVGEIEGLCFDPITGQLIVHHNRGTRVVAGIPVGFYPGYDKEIHEIYIYDVTKRPENPGCESPELQGEQGPPKSLEQPESPRELAQIGVMWSSHIIATVAVCIAVYTLAKRKK